MRKRIFISIFVTAVFAMSLAIAIIIPILYQSFVAENRKALVSESHYIATAMKSLDNVTYLKNVGVTSNDRITLIAPDGTVLYDTDGTVLYDNQYTEDTMENHKDRPEFQGALENGTGEDSRLSSTLSESTYYYALRLDDGNVLRMANTTRNTLGVFGSTASIIASPDLHHGLRRNHGQRHHEARGYSPVFPENSPRGLSPLNPHSRHYPPVQPGRVHHDRGL